MQQMTWWLRAYSIASPAMTSSVGTSRPSDLFGRTTPVSAMSYRHMGFDWSSEAIANAVGRKRISYIGGNLCLSLLIQASNCCCDWR
jgi:hypothetical protein